MVKHVVGTAAFAAVDPKKDKVHERPYDGQRWMQIHDGGQRITWGRVIGLQEWQDKDGNVVNWKAYVWDGFRTPYSVTKNDRWRSASDWHAASADVQDDPAVGLAQALAQVAALEKQVAALGTRLAMLDTIPRAEVEGALTELDGRLTAIEQAPQGEAPVVDPVSEVARTGAPAARGQSAGGKPPAGKAPKKLAEMQE